MKKRFSKIYVEITNVCNLKCKFCLETNREKRFMQIDEFEMVINKIKGYTDLILLHVKGEPLLHPNLKEMLDICDKNGIKVNITTNTTLLFKNVRTLAQSKALRQLNLSIHDLEQNGIVNENEFEKIVKVVNEIKMLNEELIISYRLWNMGKIGENKRNCSFLKILEKEYKVPDIYEKCLENSFVELGKKIFLNQDIEFKWPNMNDEIISKVGKCYGLKNQVAILANGDVVPCCLDTNGDINLGNIFIQDFQEILDSLKAKRIIDGFNNSRLVEELCKRCDFIKKIN